MNGSTLCLRHRLSIKGFKSRESCPVRWSLVHDLGRQKLSNKIDWAIRLPTEVVLLLHPFRHGIFRLLKLRRRSLFDLWFYHSQRVGLLQHLLLMNQILQPTEGCAEVVKDISRLVTITCSVVGGINWIHDYKCLLVNLRQWIEWPKLQLNPIFLLSVCRINSVLSWVKTVRIKVQKSH